MSGRSGKAQGQSSVETFWFWYFSKTSGPCSGVGSTGAKIREATAGHRLGTTRDRRVASSGGVVRPRRALVNRPFEGESCRSTGSHRRYGVGVLRGARGNYRAGPRVGWRAGIGGEGSPIVRRCEAVFGNDQVAGRQPDAVGITIVGRKVGVGNRVSDHRTRNRIGWPTDARAVGHGRGLG